MIRKLFVLSVVLMFGLVSVTMLMSDQKKVDVKKVDKNAVKAMKQLADLTITFCKHQESDVTQLKVTVKNIGNKASIPCKLLVEDLTDKNNPKKHVVDFPALGPQKMLTPIKQEKQANATQDQKLQVAKKPHLQLASSKTIIVKCPWPVYVRVIRTTIDSTNVVQEWKENNNQCFHDTIPR
jgi:hypothetical protein